MSGEWQHRGDRFPQNAHASFGARAKKIGLHPSMQP